MNRGKPDTGASVPRRPLLGQGTFGRVYAERDGNRFYAVKEYVDDRREGLSLHYIKELVALHTFRKSTHVVRIVDSSSKPILHVRMPEEQCSLDRLLRYHNKSTEQLEVWRCVLVDALQELHGRGVIHRDVKPANILLCRNDRLRLCDFGASIFVYRDDQVLEENVCTYPYAAPEMLAGKPYSESCDIWSVGVVIMDLYFRRVSYLPPDDGADRPMDVYDWIMRTHDDNMKELPLNQWRDMMAVDTSKRLPKTNWRFVSPPNAGGMACKAWTRCGISTPGRNNAINYMAYLAHRSRGAVTGLVLHVAISMLNSYICGEDAKRALHRANLCKFAHAAVSLANKFIGHEPLALSCASLRLYELRMLISLLSDTVRMFDLVDIRSLPQAIRRMIVETRTAQ